MVYLLFCDTKKITIDSWKIRLFNKNELQTKHVIMSIDIKRGIKNCSTN